MVFGLLTFGMPLGVGIGVARLFGYGWVSALLIGSLLASHTLLGFPIVQRLGLTSREPVTVTVGATIFTDLASLLVLEALQGRCAVGRHPRGHRAQSHGTPPRLGNA